MGFTNLPDKKQSRTINIMILENPTNLAEILPAAKTLSRAERYRLIQLLAEDLAREDHFGVIPGGEYEIWSPYDADEAAQTALNYLEARQKK